MTIGGGEFGRGFYAQSSRSNALTWALNNPRTRAEACVLELEIADPPFQQLKHRRLDFKCARRLRQTLRNQRATGTYVANVDVVIGPLESDPAILQYKFESQDSESLLNGVQTKRTI